MGCKEREDKAAGSPTPRIAQYANCSGALTFLARGSNSASEILNMIVLAPMPMASVIRAIAVNPGDFMSTRMPYRMSCHSVSIAY